MKETIDRITTIFNDNETLVYLVHNDENTGEFFQKNAGLEAMSGKVGGNLNTEIGLTIACEVLPIRASTQTARITARSKPPESETASGGGDFADTTMFSGCGLAGLLTAATSDAIRGKIRIRSPAARATRSGHQQPHWQAGG
mgnify:FL=1